MDQIGQKRVRLKKEKHRMGDVLNGEIIYRPYG